MHDVLRPPRRRWELAHDREVQLLALIGGLPAVVVTVTLLWTGGYAPKIQWTFGALAFGAWIVCAAAIRSRVVFPLQTLTNLLSALREGDYSLRARQARREDALGEVLREINALGDTLHRQRRTSIEATALLEAVMEAIDVAIFTVDDDDRVRLVNRAGAELLGQPASELLGQRAAEIGLADCLEDGDTRMLAHGFAGGGSGRWSLRRATFRAGGRPHRLVVLADVSQPLREEERAAWQRLIRVLGHELNNSLAPIQSIAQSLATLVAREPARRPDDWEEDLSGGLDVIGNRAEALGRFMAAYGRLARLPAPTLQREEIEPLVRRAAALETRLTVELRPPPEPLSADLDADQIGQALINLIHNAADATLEAGGAGAVRVGWHKDRSCLEISVEDDGPGLANEANLFVPFFTTKATGSGIGLVLCRQIAEAHGGSLTLGNRGRGEQGAMARLRLPAAGKLG